MDAPNIVDHARLLRERFVLQDEVFVKQWKQDDRAGYRKVLDGFGNERPLNETDLVNHIKGEHTVGIYHLKDDMIKTICLDVDSADDLLAKDQVEKIARFLVAEFGKNKFLVEYSGSKGYHIWIFFDPVVTANFGLRLGRWIADHVGIIEGVSIEVFPKQDTTHGGYGNLVKLPWGVNIKTNNRCVFVNGRFEKIEKQYEALKNVKVWKVHEQEFLNLHKIPDIERSTYEAGDKFLCMTTMLDDGLIQGHRDVGLHKLASFLRQNGIPIDYTKSIMKEANDRSRPPAPKRDVDEKIEGAYKNKYYVSPCKEQGLDIYCSPDCALFERKAEIRGVTVEQLRRIVGRGV